MPYEDRVERALQKIATMRNFTPPQQTWLKRIGAQVKREKVVDRKAIRGGGGVPVTWRLEEPR